MPASPTVETSGCTTVELRDAARRATPMKKGARLAANALAPGYSLAQGLVVVCGTPAALYDVRPNSLRTSGLPLP